jgi:hypothetical protein
MVLHTNLRELYCENMKFTNINRKLYQLICMCWILSDWLVKYGKTVKKLKMKRKSEISKRKQGMRNYGSTEAY